VLATTGSALALLLAAFGPRADSVPLYKDHGKYGRAGVGARHSKAQAYFNQGLRLLYAFNHEDAIRSFNEAIRLSPDCAICYWGVAYALGPHINAGMDSATGVVAYQMTNKAVGLMMTALPVEAALIDALRYRYVPVPAADRKRLDQQYANAMARASHRFPDDPDVSTLYAEALMDQQPWNYWDRATGEPYDIAVTAQPLLERVIKKYPDHPGACHLYIHLMEAVAPEKAVPCAERLASLMPGAGHIVHMPAHIYIRVGRYADAITANEHAVHQDEVYIEGQHPFGFGVYKVAYVPHNMHFLALAATLAGRSAQAIEAAQRTAAMTSVDVVKRMPPAEPYLHYRFLTLVTFGRWDDVLALPRPPADLPYSHAMAQYARGVAFAAKGDFAQAQAALDTLKQIGTGGMAPYSSAGWTTPATNIEIAQHALIGEIAARSGKFDDAVAHFTAAMKIEDQQLYTEPPDWYYPIRHSLGAALLKAGKPADAEQRYREDLKRFPENGWSLFGLAQALRAQNKGDDAAAVEARFQKAWATADVTLIASRF
jgi:tetratricopeptide (TPR) repeat protein